MPSRCSSAAWVARQDHTAECVLCSAHSSSRVRLPQYGSSRRSGERGSVPVTMIASTPLSQSSSIGE